MPVALDISYLTLAEQETIRKRREARRVYMNQYNAMKRDPDKPLRSTATNLKDASSEERAEHFKAKHRTFKKVSYHKNPEKFKVRASEYRSRNPDAAKQSSDKCRMKPESKARRQQHIEQQYAANPEAAKAKFRETYLARKPAANAASNKWKLNNRDKINHTVKERYDRDPVFALTCRVRARLRSAIKSGKAGSAVKDLGCTVAEIKTHLEKQFLQGMTWENNTTHGWHIDHVEPLANFDLTDRSQFLKACHYTNLQPLWAVDNLSKGSRTMVVAT